MSFVNYSFHISQIALENQIFILFPSNYFQSFRHRFTQEELVKPKYFSTCNVVNCSHSITYLFIQELRNIHIHSTKGIAFDILFFMIKVKWEMNGQKKELKLI